MKLLLRLCNLLSRRVSQVGPYRVRIVVRSDVHGVGLESPQCTPVFGGP